MMQPLSHFLLLFLAVCLRLGTITAAADCDCGYLDPDTQSLYTQSIIVYFNETDALDPTVLAPQKYEHKVEHGWRSIFRQGATPDNVVFTNDSGVHGVHATPGLQLNIDEANLHNHLVEGACVQSVRQDIQFGSFQAGIRSPANNSAGSAMTFILPYNSSQSMQMDFLTMKSWELARITNLVNGEWPAYDTVNNYSILRDAGIDPYHSFVDVRMDWNQTDVSFAIEGNVTRAITKHDRSLPQAAAPLQFKIWSTGDTTYMDGPPLSYGANGAILYVRAFFNSSTWDSNAHATFDERCAAAATSCLTTDMTLRESSNYTEESTRRWKSPPENQSIRKLAGIIAGACSTLGVLALVNVFFRRTPWHKLRSLGRGKEERESTSRAGSNADSSTNDSAKGWDHTPASGSGYSTPIPRSGIQTPLPRYSEHTPRSGAQTPVPSYDASPVSSTSNLHATVRRKGSQEDEITPMPVIRESRWSNSHAKATDGHPPFSDGISVTSKGKGPHVAVVPIYNEGPHANESTQVNVDPITATVTPKAPAVPEAKKKIDYLAGLVAIACLGVTLHHFCQTFWPWMTEGYGNTAHYPGFEKWGSIFIGSYALTQLWIGPFFLTSTRFLSTNYLKNGNLVDIAKKMLRRAPRLFVPIIITDFLQYFLLSLGLADALQQLPSVGWATWPYVVPAPNFGAFLNDLIELLYLIPNKVPEVVTHYCVGVLWTVPVQLQFTYVVLVAAVLIRPIKTPWKRAAFYTFVILNGWYAKSWSACHWGGLVLSDLEATYKWKTYLEAHKWVKYLVMFGAFCCAMGSPLAAVFNSTWSFETYENSIHPDPATGKPIWFSPSGPQYPDYFEPDLVILTFSIGLQILVELSTWFQKFLSLKPILLLHPHIMTIYLTHGFVFWTWGAFVTVTLAKANVPYWANLLVTLVVSYAALFALASVLTPLMEIPVQASMRALDRWMKDDPVPKIPTTMPYSKSLVLDREGEEETVSKGEKDV